MATERNTQSTFRWLSAKLQYIQSDSNGDIVVSHQAIDIYAEIEMPLTTHKRWLVILIIY